MCLSVFAPQRLYFTDLRKSEDSVAVLMAKTRWCSIVVSASRGLVGIKGLIKDVFYDLIKDEYHI